MSAVLIGQFEPGSPEWHEARGGRLGGSEIAAVIGLSPWESKLSLWHRKRGELGDVEVTEIMDAGNRLESVVLDWFNEQHPEFIVTRGATYRHAERDFQNANPDGECYRVDGDRPPGEGSTTGVECKFSLYGDEFGKEGTDEIPVHYRCQVLWYMDVMGWDGMWLAVFIGAQGGFRQYWIPADASEQEFLRKHGEAFIDSLLDWDQRPDIDGHVATHRAIREMHPDIDRDLNVEIPLPLSDDWHATKRAVLLAEAAARQANSRLLDVMGDARRGQVDGVNHVIRVSSPGGAAPHLRSSLPKPKKDGIPA